MARSTIRNATTSDDFSAALTRVLPNTVVVVVQIANAGVTYELDASSDGSGFWSEGGDLLTTVGTLGPFRQCSGIRFKSLAPGVPAQLFAELLDVDELAEGGLPSLSPFTQHVSAEGEVGSDVSLPVGAVVPWAGDGVAPSGWLVCDGAAVSRTTYAALFDVVGVIYGPGDGSSTFNVPDLRGRVAAGKGTHVDVNAVGDSDGLAVANRRPSHVHSTGTIEGAPSGAGTTFLTGTVGAGGPAYLTLNYLVKAT